MLRLNLQYGALGLLGLAVGAIGTGGHRFEPYWGSVMVLALVLAAGTFARAWMSWPGLWTFSLTWIATVLGLYFIRASGDSIVILGDTLGKVWFFGGSIMAVLPAFIPRGLVAEGAHV